MWELYLVIYESGVRYENLTVFQIQLSKSFETVPLKRNYIVDWERAQAKKENNQARSAYQTGTPMMSTAGPSGIASISGNFSTVRNGEPGDAR
jgi:uncharacterized protein (DUF2345 family)